MACRTKPRCLIQWPKRSGELIFVQYPKAFQILQFLWFLHGTIALLRKFSHSSLHSNWQHVQDSSPIFIWLFLPITVNTKPFSEEPKPDPLLRKIPFGLPLPAKLCFLTLAWSPACAVLQLSIRYSSLQMNAPFPFSFPFSKPLGVSPMTFG